VIAPSNTLSATNIDAMHCDGEAMDPVLGLELLPEVPLAVVVGMGVAIGVVGALEQY